MYFVGSITNVLGAMNHVGYLAPALYYLMSRFWSFRYSIA